MIEHRLAHLAHKQERRARYVGTRKNLFDVRRHSALLLRDVTETATEREWIWLGACPRPGVCVRLNEWIFLE